MSQPAETIKHYPQEFGGVQHRLLSPEEISERMCAAQFCGQMGYAQLPILGEDGQWRVICHVHAFKASRLIGDALYNPGVIEEAEKISETGKILTKLGNSASPEFLDPDSFRCDRCGGRMVVDAIGIYAGRRWTHTCP